MDLRLIGLDPDTGGGNCPAVWVDEQAPSGPEIVLQGWRADEQTEARTVKDSPLPETEAVIRIPARMVPLIRKACDAAERAQL